MEAYLEKLLSQIRCKKARPYISDEIRSHIESQIEDNLSSGMEYAEAEKNAVADMGDPIDVGILLDKIHKPKIAWKLLAIIFGFIIMCGIYFIDYTLIAKYSKIVGLFIMAMGILRLTGFFGGVENGAYYSIGFGIFRISAMSIMMFYVPLYGAILYKYKGGGVFSLLKVCIWLMVPVIITFRMPNIVVAGIIMVSMLIQLTVAIMKGWFRVPAKKAIITLWTVFMLLPIILLFAMYRFRWLADYQIERIRSFLSASGDGFYLISVLRILCKDLEMVGNSGNDVIGGLPNFNRDYIFSYILNSYGLIAGIVVSAVLATLVVFIFGTAIKQKNELGMVMGFGCGMIFLLNVVINILCSVGILPPTSSFLPFFSIGRSNILLCYALVGIMMSIYRYKDVYPKSIKTSQIAIEKNFMINI